MSIWSLKLIYLHNVYHYNTKDVKTYMSCAVMAEIYCNYGNSSDGDYIWKNGRQKILSSQS